MELTLLEVEGAANSDPSSPDNPPHSPLHFPAWESPQLCKLPDGSLG